jgi:hypothetical protein
VIREDPFNRDLLLAGTDVGAYVSVDRGAHWQQFMSGLPTVPVHDLKIHPRAHELIAATHGRSIWIVNILPLEQLADSTWNTPAHLFVPRIAYQFGEPPALGESPGHKLWVEESPDYGAELVYRVAKGSARASTNADAQTQDDDGGNGAARRGRRGAGGQNAQARLIITNVRGDTVRSLTGPATPGIHTVTWDFRGTAPPEPALTPAGVRDSVIAARKLDMALDSMEKAGRPKAAIDRVRSIVASGDFGNLFRRGRGGGGRAEPGEWVDRPGESQPPREAARRPARAAGAGGADVDPEVLQDIYRDLRSVGAIQRRGGFGRGGAPTMMPGDYLVTLVVGGTTSSQVLRVEGYVEGSEGFVGDEEEDGGDRR